MSQERINIEHSDQAPGRVVKAVIMMVDAAVGKLQDLGHPREDIVILEQDRLEPNVIQAISLRNRVVFQVRAVQNVLGSVEIVGQWTRKIWHKSWWRRLLFWR